MKFTATRIVNVVLFDCGFYSVSISIKLDADHEAVKATAPITAIYVTKINCAKPISQNGVEIPTWAVNTLLEPLNLGNDLLGAKMDAQKAVYDIDLHTLAKNKAKIKKQIYLHVEAELDRLADEITKAEANLQKAVDLLKTDCTLPLSGGLIYNYAAGTTKPQATYTDYTGGTLNANPVVLDSRG